MRTLIIIPAYNEEEALPGVLDDLSARLPDFDVLVVDDGSGDRTAVIARRHGAAVARLPFNMGIGAALRTGFRFAAEQGYDRALQFDADGQHDAQEVAQLLNALDEGADLAIGSRFTGAAGDYHVGATRGVAMSLLRIVLRVLLGRRFTDTSSGFRGFSRPMLEHYAHWYPREYMDSVEALVMAANGGFRIREVPVTMHERVAGVASNRSLRLAFHYLRLIFVLVSTMSLRARRHAEASS